MPQIAAMGAGVVGAAKGLGKLGSAFGVGGDQHDYFDPGVYDSTAKDYLTNQSQMMGNGDVSSALANYGPSSNLADIIGGLEKSGNLTGGQQISSAYDQALTNGVSGSQIATQQVQSNPMLAGLFGKGGSLDNAEADENTLRNKGFSLTPEDHEAYGQASDSLARLFGGQEKALSNTMADRGFGAGASGMSGAAFTGLQGNKNEQLANAQMQIANTRMQNATQRLQQTRQYIGQMGQQANTAIQDQYGRQQQGVTDRQNELMNSQHASDQMYNSVGNQMQASQKSKESNKDPTLGQAFGQGLLGSAQAMGSGPGRLSNKLVDTAGSGAGMMGG